MALVDEAEKFASTPAPPKPLDAFKPTPQRPFESPPYLAQSRMEDLRSMKGFARFAYDHTDPKVLDVVGRLDPGLPTFVRDIDRLPDFARSAAKGLVTGASVGAIELPVVKDETTPMYMVRSAFTLMGGVIGFSAISAGARTVGLTTKLGQAVSQAGAFGGLEAARRAQHDEEILTAGFALQTILAGTLGTLGGEEQGLKALRNFELREPMSVSTLYGSLKGGLKKTRLSEIDEDWREVVRSYENIIKATPKGEINFDQLRDLATRAAKGEAIGNNITIEYVDMPHLYQMVKPRLNKYELEELFGRQGRAEELFGGAVPRAGASVRAGLAVTPEGEIAATRGTPAGSGPPSTPVSRLREANAELDRRLGVGQNAIESREASNLVDETIDISAKAGGSASDEVAHAERLRDVVGGSQNRASKGAVKLPSGRIISEEEAIRRRGRPASAPILSGDVELIRGSTGRGSSRVEYIHKPTGKRMGSATYVRLSREGDKTFFRDMQLVDKGPSLGKVRVSRSYVPVEIGEKPEYMILEVKVSPGFSEYIVKDLSRSSSFAQFDPTTRSGRNFAALAKRLGVGEKVEGADIIQFKNYKTVGRGGAPIDAEDIADIESGLAALLASGKSGRSISYSSLRPMKFVMADLELADGLPYFRMFEAVEDAKEAAKESAFRMSQQAFGVLRGMNHSKRIQALDYLAGTAEQKAAVRLDSNDMQKLDEFRHQVLDPLFQNWHKSSFQEYVENVVRPFRVVGVNDPKLVNIPAKFRGVAGLADSGRLNLVERDAAKFFNQHLRLGAFHQEAEPTIREAFKFVNRIGIPKDSRRFLANYLRKTDGFEDDFVNRVLAPIYQTFWKSLGYDVPAREARNIISSYNALLHAGLLGFRPAPLIRNLLGGIQTSAPRIGFGWYLRGVRESFTVAGKKAFAESGIPAESATIIDQLDALATSATTRNLTNLSRTVMSPYSRADLVPRSHMYLAARRRLLEASKKLPKGATDEQVFSATGLWNFHPVIRKEVLALWRKGDFEGAGKLYGIHAQQDSQWVYRTGYRPELIQGEAGRLLGTFGVWPLNNIEYFRQMALPESLGGLPQTPYAKRLAWNARWVMANMGLVGAFGAVGSQFGLGVEAMNHTLGWTGLGSLSYGGGTALQIPDMAAGMLYELTVRRETGQQTARVKRVAESLVPLSELWNDFSKSRGKTTTNFVLGKGFQQRVVTEEPRSVGEQAFRFLTGVQRRPNRK